MAHKHYGFYTVVAGRERGIFDSWEECRRSVNGYAENWFKGFYSAAEAAEYAEHCMENEGKFILSVGGQRREFDDLYLFVDAAYRI